MKIYTCDVAPIEAIRLITTFFMLTLVGVAPYKPSYGAAPALQPPPSTGLFPFDIPQDDALKGTATDMSFLSKGEAGAGGQIIVKDGHFIESMTGRRIRFVGLNTMTEYPDHATAETRASHWAKMGINLVRCHMIDGGWQPIWQKPVGLQPIFDPAAMDKLDYFLYQLKEHGIYVDLNLHAGHTFQPANGFPASVESISEKLDKHIDMMDEGMIDWDQRYDKAFLTHVNPYTHLSYAKDPMVAIVEVNNEDTLLYAGSDGANNYYRQLPEPFRSNCMVEWNAFLAKKYQTTQKLRAAWIDDPQLSASAPVESMSSTSPYTLEDHVGDAKIAVTDPGDSTTAPDIDITNPTSSQPASSKQVNFTGISLIDKARYVISFRSKADKQRIDNLTAGTDQKDWHGIGLAVGFSSGPKWRNYSFQFQAEGVVPEHSRLSFIFGGNTGDLTVSEVKLHRVNADDVLPPAQSLETKSIDLPPGYTAAQTSDWTEFLSGLELSYANRMRQFLKQDVGLDANVVVSQVCYGGMSGIRRESDSDFVDNHWYWSHPIGTVGSLDPLNWKIYNQSLVSETAKSQFALLWLAGSRVEGKPYTISEYNAPAPNDYQAEAVPLMTTFALIQDWDGIFWFSDQASGAAWFDICGNPAKEAFLPAAAAMFRLSAIPPAGPSVDLNVDADSLLTRNVPGNVWETVTNRKVPDLLSARFGVTVTNDGKASHIEQSGQANVDPSSGVKIVSSTSGPIYVAWGPSVIASAGYLGGQSISQSSANIAVQPFGNNFASMTLTTNDNKPISESRRMLITIMGHTEKQGEIWNADRTSVGRDWGKGPALAEGIPATFTITNPNVKHVWALDPTGTRIKEVPVSSTQTGITFSVSPEYQTIWYEVGV